MTRIFKRCRARLGEGQTRQEKMDEKEFDDAVEDVFNDAAGNAFGWLIASLSYWLVVGLAEPGVTW